jgi:hypothetical protein
MNVRIRIPIDLHLHHTGTFRIMKQVTTPDGRTSWQTIGSTTAVSGGEYLADLEPGFYQKTLETAQGSLAFSSFFQITEDGALIEDIGPQ